MKKRILILTLIVFMPSMVLYGCAWGSPPPWGKWKSEDPNLLLYFHYHSSVGLGTGQYVIDGEAVEIVLIGRYKASDLIIRNAQAEKNRETMNDSNIYFSGTYKQKNNKLYYTVTPYYQELRGYKKIVFEKVEDDPTPEAEDTPSDSGDTP